MYLVLFGIDFKTASLSVREQFYFVEKDLPQAYRLAKSMGLSPIILSTCNRTEIYIWVDSPKAEILQQFMSCYHKKSIEPFLKKFYTKTGFRALDHLFQTACGLKSLVVGENQILAQLKKSYHLALLMDKDIPSQLSRIFEVALSCGKAARTRTNIGQGAMSLGSVTIDLLREIYEKDSAITIVVIGAGEIAEEILNSLKHYEKASIIVLNRTKENAENLIKLFFHRRIRFAEMDCLYKVIDEAHLIITSTSSPDLLICKEDLQKKCKIGKFTFFLDLAVPRNIDASISELTDVILYTIDDLERIVQENMERRHMHFDEVKKIVDEKLNEWEQWRESSFFAQVLRKMGDVISNDEKKSLWRHFKQLKKEEKEVFSLNEKKAKDLIIDHLNSLR